MKVSVIDNHGQVLQMMDIGQYSLSNLSIAEGTFAVGLHPENMSDYWDGNAFVSIGEPPSESHYFDYEIKQWVDPRTLEIIKAEKWDEIKQQRDQLEFGGFEFEGNVYDSDQVSQGRIMGAASAGVSQVWTLADNTTVELNASQLQQLYMTLQTHVAMAHERGRIARLAIASALTKEEVEAIEL